MLAEGGADIPSPSVLSIINEIHHRQTSDAENRQRHRPPQEKWLAPSPSTRFSHVFVDPLHASNALTAKLIAQHFISFSKIELTIEDHRM